LVSHAWYAVWTRSHYEYTVRDQLQAKGFDAFLPEMGQWSRGAGSQRVVRAPIFPGYLFVRACMDKHRYIDALSVRGIVKILEDGWKRLTPVEDHEVSALELVHQSDLPVLPHSSMVQGDHVRVTAGPLSGAEGYFVQDHPSKGRLVVSIGLLGRGVAVELDCTAVTPC
jgi:transcription antitermination factor NusG